MTDLEQRAAVNAAAFRGVLDALARGDVEAVVRLHTEDVTIEYPFAPPGFPALVHGCDELRAFEQAIADRVATCAFHDLRIRAFAHEDGLVAEYRGEVTLTNGRPYANTYCAVVQCRDGLLHHVRKLYDPLVIGAAGLEAS